MKLKHFFRFQDASFSTSIAARTLLRSFFVALLLSLFGGLYVYVNSSFDREISKRRGYMSGAILEAQRFFTGHEILLKNLSLSAVRNTTIGLPALPLTDTWHVWSDTWPLKVMVFWLAANEIAGNAVIAMSRAVRFIVIILITGDEARAQPILRGVGQEQIQPVQVIGGRAGL